LPLKKSLKKYNLAMTLFVLAIFIILTINLISLDVFRFEEEEVTKIHYADNISDTHKKLIEMFNRKYKGEIKVIPIDLPFTKFSTNERKELLVRSLRGKNKKIDVFATDQIWIPRFLKWAEPLDKYFEKSEKEEILESAYQTCINEGKLFSIPMYMDFGVLFYRKDLIDQFQKGDRIKKQINNSIRWQDFIDLGEQWNESHEKNSFFLYLGDNYEGLICNYLEILYSKEGQYDPKQKGDLLKKKKIRSLKFLKDLIYEYELTPQAVKNFKEVDLYRYAMKNDIPFFRGWISSLKDTSIFGKYSEKVKFLDYAPLPHFDDKHSRYVFGGWNLMISEFSQNKQEAVKFLKFIISPEAQKFIYEHAYYMPVLENFYQKQNILSKKEYKLFSRVIKKYGSHRPSYENYTRISNVVSYYINQCLSHKSILPGTSLRKAQKSIESGEIILE